MLQNCKYDVLLFCPRNVSSKFKFEVYLITRNTLDCDQSNVLLAHLFDSPWGVSYRWSMVTRHLSGTVIEIFSLEDNGVMTLTIGVT